VTFEPTTAEDIARACDFLRARGPFPRALAQGLEANDPDRMRAAFAHLVDEDRLDGLRELVERFRNKRDFGVWARVQSSRLYQQGGEFAAALADIDDLMLNFPQRVAAHWWLNRARCLLGLKREDEAAAALREGLERFPDEMTLRVALASALKAAGRREEAVAELDEIGRRYPDDRRTPPLLAQAAEERSQWARALEIWDSYGVRFDAAGEPQAAAGRARALFRLDRVDEATAELEALLAREPDNAQGLRELAAIYFELGEAARVRDLRVRLMQRHAKAAKPEWWAALARAHHDLREDAAGAAALAELERRFPDSALAETERLRLAKEREHGHDDLKALIEAARARFPQDFDLRANWVWILLSLGRLEDAEREVAALEAEEAGGYALTTRLRLEADRGDESLGRFLARWGEGRTYTAGEAIQLGYQLIEIRTSWAFEAGARIVADALAREPGNSRLKYMRIRFAIALGQDAEALALIDALPQRFARHDYLEIRAWAETKRGRDDEAKALSRRALASAYHAGVEAPIHKLTRISSDDRPPPGEGVTAYVVFRNEAAQIPGFLAHHRRLGVRRFVFFDHLSDDGGREIALREPDVVVYDCPDSYQLSWSGRRWVNEIVAREGASGWGLQLDMDEHLIYPGCESLEIDGFVGYLDARGFEGVRGFMLDVFPPRLVDDSGAPTPFAEHVWYDDDYTWFGLPRPPYLSPIGGVRARLFEAKEYLHKVPLWRLDAGLLINSHETTPLRFADVSTALLHYKLMNVALRGRGEERRAGAAFLEADADVEAIRRHARYAARLERLWRADLRAPGVSRRLEDSLTLAGRGLMEASGDYRGWLAAGARR